mmetsp:Transcript_2308/g.3246  ORF Transcript_2308/g.3246 Transcript_2308/m.3246 type:complete len:197 (-) Transcript_2308:1543-2133(-)
MNFPTQSKFLFFKYFLFIVFIVIHRAQGETDEKEHDAEEIQISSECAAVVLVGGSAIGGIAATTLAPSLLGILGFTQAGIMSGSFAAWWQSTMPLIASGTLFATLQSIAMTTTGMGTVVIGSTLGGASSAVHLKNLCQVIDSIDKDSTAGFIISSTMKAVRKSPSIADWSRDKIRVLSKMKSNLCSFIKKWVLDNM